MIRPVGTLFARFRRRGILYDANLLLLWWAARHLPRQQVLSFKRLDAFTNEDAERILRMYAQTERVVTTPHVLTELSNLAGHLGEPMLSRLRQSGVEDIRGMDEQAVASAVAACRSEFPRLGLTDCAILSLPPGSLLVITTDRALHGSLVKAGIDSINYNHLRSKELLS